MVQSAGPDPLMTCPLDESHRILRSRMQFHLVRCLRNHSLGMRLKCPWNPLHIIDKFAYEDHYKRECEDMPRAMEFMCPVEESRDVGSVPVTATNDLMPPADEDWDAEPGPVGTYDPAKNVEGRPVLRGSVGLSKAKRKEFRNAERKRFQTLGENGPIQTTSRPQAPPEASKSLRVPRKKGLAVSADTSTIDELNASNASADDTTTRKNKTELKKLRVAHEPSPVLTYKPSCSNVGNNSITTDGESHAIDEVPNLRQLFGASFHDAASRISGVSSCANVEALRNNLERNVRMSNVSNSALHLSDVENPAFLDEAAALPKLVSPVDTVIALTQQLAVLTTKQNKIEDLKEMVRQQISQYKQLPNLVSSSASSLNHHDKMHDDGKSSGSVSAKVDSSPAKPSNGSHNANPKCAANFSKFARNANLPDVGVGRGMVNALAKDKNRPPGWSEKASKEEVKGSPDRERRTNPFELPGAARANISQRTYTLSAANADEEDSAYGYQDSE